MRRNQGMSKLADTTESAVPEIERTVARMKSYTGSAVLVFFLYLLFWLPGFIVNYIYLDEAQKIEKIAGQSLPGTGCLYVMFWLNVIGLILGIACAGLFLILPFIGLA